jgi:hypothetical protein
VETWWDALCVGKCVAGFLPSQFSERKRICACRNGMDLCVCEQTLLTARPVSY